MKTTEFFRNDNGEHIEEEEAKKIDKSKYTLFKIYKAETMGDMGYYMYLKNPGKGGGKNSKKRTKKKARRRRKKQRTKRKRRRKKKRTKKGKRRRTKKRR